MRFKLLKEMADSKSRISSQLCNNRKSYLEHLIKLYLWKNSEYANHWKSEIYSFYNDIPKLRTTNKYPNSDFIYQAIFGYCEDSISDSIDDKIEFILYKENNLNKLEYDKSDIIKFIKDYSIWLSSNLSSKGHISFRDAYTKMNELLNI